MSHLPTWCIYSIWFIPLRPCCISFFRARCWLLSLLTLGCPSPLFHLKPLLFWLYIIFLGSPIYICGSYKLSCRASSLAQIPSSITESHIHPSFLLNKSEVGCPFSLNTPHPEDHLRPPIQFSRRRQWHPTPVLVPGKSHGRRSLVGCSPWSRWVGHNWATSLLHFTFMHWRRKWQPTPVFLPGESQGGRSLVGCRLWGRTN